MTVAPRLRGQIAVVAGATRGAGRGIARGLGEAGATVYCTGRSVRGNPSAYNRPETIEDTAEQVTAAGGVGIALRVDHAVEACDTVFGGGGNALTDVVKCSLKGFTHRMAEEIRTHRVTAVAITPGFLRSESMLQHFGVTEANWRDAGKKDTHFLESESPLFIGRAVAALAADPTVFERSGDILSSWELGRQYGFTDADGRRPDWGVYGAKIFESTGFAVAFRRHVVFLERMTERARQYVGGGADKATEGKSGKRRAAR